MFDASIKLWGQPCKNNKHYCNFSLPKCSFQEKTFSQDFKLVKTIKHQILNDGADYASNF